MSYTEPPPADNSAYKMAALAALATGGTAAKAALDNARGALEASKATASKDAMSAAAQYGLGAQAGQELAAPIDRAYNRDIAAVGTKVGAVTRGLDALATPLSNVLDTKFAAALASRKGSGGGGGRGGGGGSKKTTPAYLDEYGSQSNLVYALKKSDPGAKFGDYTQAQQQAIAKGVDPLTAQRLFKNTATGDKLNSWYDQALQQNVSANQFRDEFNQQYQQGNIPAGAVTYYTQQYRQATSQPSAYKPKKK